MFNLVLPFQMHYPKEQPQFSITVVNDKNSLFKTFIEEEDINKLKDCVMENSEKVNNLAKIYFYIDIPSGTKNELVNLLEIASLMGSERKMEIILEQTGLRHVESFFYKYSIVGFPFKIVQPIFSRLGIHSLIVKNITQIDQEITKHVECNYKKFLRAKRNELALELEEIVSTHEEVLLPYLRVKPLCHIVVSYL